MGCGQQGFENLIRASSNWHNDGVLFTNPSSLYIKDGLVGGWSSLQKMVITDITAKLMLFWEYVSAAIFTKELSALSFPSEWLLPSSPPLLVQL